MIFSTIYYHKILLKSMIIISFYLYCVYIYLCIVNKHLYYIEPLNMVTYVQFNY